MSVEGIELVLKKFEIENLLFQSSKLLDQGNFEDWIDLFTEECSYKAITVDNYKKNYVLGIMDDNKARMKDRVEVIRKWWNVEDTKSLHTVSNIQIHFVHADRVTCESCFSIFETDRFGKTKLTYVGNYLDSIVCQNGQWKFNERLAVVDTHLLSEIYIPI